MAQAPQAVFSLEGYRIVRIFYQTPESNDANLLIEFNPSGKYNQKDNKYLLMLNLIVSNEDTKESVVNADIEAIYDFSNTTKIEALPDYFYGSSLAIVFPYLRAFISNLTLQANVQPVILPLFNLTQLGDVLKSNTVAE